MKRYVVSPAATADVEQIEAFLDEHAPHATDNVLHALRDAMWKRRSESPQFSPVRSSPF